MERKATYMRAWREAGGLARRKGGYTLDYMVERMAELGEETTGATLSRIERGITPYNQDLIEAYAAALDVPVSYLVERNPNLPPAKLYDIVDHLDNGEMEQAEKVLRAMFGDRS